MNYGKYETERRLKSLHSKSAKYTSKLFLNIFKALFVLFLFCVVVGASIGFGMVKGIIDNAPTVDILNIQPVCHHHLRCKGQSDRYPGDQRFQP